MIQVPGNWIPDSLKGIVRFLGSPRIGSSSKIECYSSTYFDKVTPPQKPQYKKPRLQWVLPLPWILAFLIMKQGTYFGWQLGWQCLSALVPWIYYVCLFFIVHSGFSYCIYRTRNLFLTANLQICGRTSTNILFLIGYSYRYYASDKIFGGRRVVSILFIHEWTW